MIGLFVPPDRWTCPTCGVTEVPDSADAEEARLAIRRAQEQHGKDHPAPWVEPSRARHPVRRKAKRTRATT